MKLFWFVFIIALCSPFSGWNQIDSTQIDTSELHVKRAVILSASVPGAGQIYNHIQKPKGQKKAYWKVPLIYAGLGSTIYFALSNNSIQKEVKAEYYNRLDNGIYSQKYLSYDNTGLITLHNQHTTRRDLLWLATGVIYLLQVVDAGVEAHFINFDVSKDLSLTVQPTLLPTNTAGVSVAFNFR